MKIETHEYVPCVLSELRPGDRVAVGIFTETEPHLSMTIAQVTEQFIHATADNPTEAGFQFFLFEPATKACYALGGVKTYTGCRYRIFGKEAK